MNEFTSRAALVFLRLTGHPSQRHRLRFRTRIKQWEIYVSGQYKQRETRNAPHGWRFGRARVLFETPVSDLNGRQQRRVFART